MGLTSTKYAHAALAVVMAVFFFAAGYASYPRGGTGLHIFDIASSEELKDLLSYSEDAVPLTMAHRGGAKEGYPENALETFENTLCHTWSFMEVDPRYTKDSVIVLFHDDTLGRTSTGRGRVSDHTYGQLKKLRLKDTEGKITDFRIPSLGEALSWARGTTILFLDDKGVAVEERVKMIKKHNAKRNAVVMAYSFEDARRIHELDPDIMIQVFIPDKKALRQFDATGIPWENVVTFVTHYSPDDEDIFELINSRGALVMIGTSRTLDRAYRSGQIGKRELYRRYHEWFDSGVNMIEADLGIELGKAAEEWRSSNDKQSKYFEHTNFEHTNKEETNHSEQLMN